MRLEKTDLNLFVVFEALYREGNVTRVAHQLSITQPAVSNILGRLRDTFDDPLFIRSTHGMQPTPMADRLIGDVRRALELMRSCIGRNATFLPGLCEKTFRLGMNDLAEFIYLPELYRRVRSEAPSTAINSYYADREGATEDLRAGRLDLLIDAPLVNARDLHQQALANFPYVALMRIGHPLLEKKLTLSRYLEAEHLHVSSRRYGRGHVDIALNRMGLKRQIAMRLQSYLVAEKVMTETDLVWTAPKVLARTLPVRFRKLPFSVDPLIWCLFWSSSAHHDPANNWLRARVEDAVASRS